MANEIRVKLKMLASNKNRLTQKEMFMHTNYEKTILKLLVKTMKEAKPISKHQQKKNQC